MALNTKTISAGVGDILNIDGGIDASSPRQVLDGDGTGLPLYLTTTRLGIRESSPDGTLHITYSGTDDTAPGLLVECTDAGTATGPDIMIKRNSSSPADNDYLGTLTFVGRNDNSQDVDYCDIYATLIDASDGSEDGLLTLRTVVAGAQNNTVNITGGKVGIGTLSPQSDLHITNTTADHPKITLDNESATDAQQGGTLAFVRRDSSNAHLVDNSVIGDITFSGTEDDGTTQVVGAFIRGITTGTWTDSSSPTELAFYTCNASSQTANQRMCILQDGSVGIGETAPDNILHIKNADGVAKSAVKIEQLDDNEPFIRFQGTTASDQTKSLSTATSVGSLTGHILIDVNGTDYWIPYYAKS